MNVIVENHGGVSKTIWHKPPSKMNSSSKVVIGYASIWTPIDFSKIPANKLTHIIYSFLNINSDGTLIFGDAGCNSCCATTFLNQLLEIKNNNKHLKIQISIGGASWASSFMPVVSSDAKRSVLVNAISNLLSTYSLDGVDIDWEFPGSGQGSQFVQLVKDLRNKLGSQYQLTCAIPSSPSNLANFNLKDANQYFDWFNVMAYDASIGTNIATHHAPLYHNPSDPVEDASGDTAVKTLISYGISTNKIVLGVPLYGYQYSVNKNDNINYGLFQKILCTKNCDVPVANKVITTQNKGTRYFDNIAKAPWLYDSGSGAFTTFEDISSVQNKINYVNTQHLKGIMFWELGNDNLDSNSVVYSVFNNLNVSLPMDQNYTFVSLPIPGISF